MSPCKTYGKSNLSLLCRGARPLGAWSKSLTMVYSHLLLHQLLLGQLLAEGQEIMKMLNGKSKQYNLPYQQTKREEKHTIISTDMELALESSMTSIPDDTRQAVRRGGCLGW